MANANQIATSDYLEETCGTSPGVKSTPRRFIGTAAAKLTPAARGKDMVV
jgi:hypothetical protein